MQNYCDLIERDSKKELGQAKRMGLVMHLAGVIERALLQTPISATESDLIEIQDVFERAKSQSDAGRAA